jgi:HlyD family secretion protein
MRRFSRGLIPLLVVITLAAIAAVLYFAQQSSNQNGVTTVSGTIEITEIHLGTQMGGRVNAVNVAEGQPIKAGQVLAEIHPGVNACTTSSCDEKIRSSINGVVLERLFEPGEIAPAGSTLLTVGDLNALTLTVYVPEDRYGQIYLGQIYPVTVDSFPGVTFGGTVSYISNQAEFTPRNVQTVQGRKNTVFAIRLSIDNPNQDLKPGMWADVALSQ